MSYYLPELSWQVTIREKQDSYAADQRSAVQGALSVTSLPIFNEVSQI